MIATPHITETKAVLTAMIHLQIPRNEIQHVMGPGISEVMAAVKEQGLSPIGPWFTHHRRMNPATFDFEICVPVNAAVKPVGRVVPGEVRVVRVARTIYQGPFEGLGAAWGELSTWITEHGHQRCADLYECYLTGPETSTDPIDWRTELSQPLMD